jgi:hypothetical protein
MKGIVDRFEGDLVVVEVNGQTKNYPRAMFPKELEIGDVVKFEGNQVVIQKDETAKLRKEIEDLMNEVWED